MKKKTKRIISFIMTVMMVVSVFGVYGSPPGKLTAKAATATVTNTGQVTYGGSFADSYKINGVRAYCIEHKDLSPWTGMSVTSSSCTNATLLKLLYYCPTGPKPWSGFDDLTEGNGIIATSLALSHVYTGTDLGRGYNFYQYAIAQPAPFTGDPDITVSPASTTSTVSGTKLKSGEFKYTAASGNTGYCTIPSGYEGFNKTANKGYPQGNKMTLNPGDVFYFQKTSLTSGTQTFTITGTGSFSATYWTPTAGSGYQTLILANGVGTADTAKVTITFVGQGNVRFHKNFESDDKSTMTFFKEFLGYSATFTIYSDSAMKNKVVSLSTKSNYYTDYYSLNPGTYYYKETTVTGAMVKNSKTGSFTVTAGGSLTIDGDTTTNDAMSGRIVAEKKVMDADGNIVEADDLEGATFNVYYNHDSAPSLSVYQSNDAQSNSVTVKDTNYVESGYISSFTNPSPTLLIATLTSDADGSLKVTKTNTFVRQGGSTWTAAGLNTYDLGGTTGDGNLPPGYYTIVEMTAPTNKKYATTTKQYQYGVPETRINMGAGGGDVTITSSSGTFKIAPVITETSPGMTLSKSTTISDNELYSVKGAEYTIYCIDGLMPNFLDPEASMYERIYAKLLGNEYTDRDGVVVIQKKDRSEMYTQLETMLKVAETKVSDGDIVYAASAFNGNLELRYDPESPTSLTPPFYCSKIAKFTIDESGTGIVSEIYDTTRASGGLNTDTLNVASGRTRIYFAIETKAPDSGAYELSNEFDYSIAYGNKQTNLQFSESDIAFMDPLDITIAKESTTDEDYDLSGAVFEIDYYDSYYNSLNSLPDAVTARWFVEVKKQPNGKYLSKFNSAYISTDPDYAGLSSAFYIDDTTGMPSMPLGTVTVKEVKAAKGFKLNSGTVTDNADVDYTDNDRTFIGQIRMVDGKAVLLGATDADASTISFTNRLDETLNLSATNSPDTVEFGMTKLAYNPDTEQDEPVGGINFKITQLNTSDLSETGKSYTFTTSADGTYYSYNNADDGFDEDGGCLVPGYTYKVEELMDTDVAKKYQKVDDVYMTVTLEDVTDGEAVIKNVLKVTKKDADGNIISETVVDEAVESTKGVVYYYNLGQFFNYPNPTLSTMEMDGTTGLHTTPNSDEAVITDTITWKYLDVKSDWTIKGILMEVSEDGESVTPLKVNGNYVMNHVFVEKDDEYEITESRYERTGYAQMEFELNSNLCKGTQFVVYEYLFKGKDNSDLTVTDGVIDTTGVFADSKGTLVSHAVFDDVSQTGYIPEIGTKAQDKTSATKLVYAGGSATVEDTVTFKRLDPNDTNGYVLVAELVDKADTTKIYATATSDVIKNKKNGEEKMNLTFDASLVEGHTLVVFEYLYLMPQVAGQGDETPEFDREKATLISTHADSEDANQTVYVPSVGTKVGKAKYPVSKTVTITDTVSYTNLLKGYDYTLAAELKVLDDEGNVVATITPADGLKNFEVTGTKDELLVSGSQNVTFTFDASGFAGKKMVVYERLYIGKFTNRDSIDETKLVGAHEDATDDKQTFELIIPLNIEKKNTEGLILGGAKMEIWTADNKTCVEAWESVEGKRHETTIKPGDYILREVEAPFGYALAADVKFTVNDNGEILVGGEVQADNLITMVDEELSALPSTGSSSAMMITLAGIIMMLGGAFIVCRRKEENS